MASDTLNSPLVSAVMPFLNAERFIEESIESILAQTYTHWELILVDDGSSDTSTQIARDYVAKYPGRIFYVDHPGHVNKGISASRNEGVRHTRGSLIAFLDSDDLWLPSKLENQVGILRAHPGASMLYGRTQYWYGWTGRPEDLRRDFIPEHGVAVNTPHPPPYLLLALYPLGRATAPSMSNIMMRRDLLDTTGGFEESFGGMFEDQAFLTKAYLTGSVIISDELWDQYRIHPESCTSNATKEGLEQTARLTFLRWFGGYLEKKGIHDERILNALEKAIEAVPERSEIHYNGWMFRVGEESEARLMVPDDKPEAMRIVIDKNGSPHPYGVQLNRPNFTLVANHTYHLTFRARADAPRQICCGVAMAHDPWDNLGLYLTLDFTFEWQTFDHEFTALASEDNARVHFDVGGSDIPVEFASISLLKADDTPAVSLINFGDLRRVTPLSRDWGYDRGMPVDRYYIEKALALHSSDIRGHVMEIQEDTYTRRFGGNRVTRSDVLHYAEGNPQATMVGDLTNAPEIPDNTFDSIVLTQTLQHIYHVKDAIATLCRILKPGGVLLATVPCISQNNDAANDWYWLFTPLSARLLFEEAFRKEDLTINTYGNVLAATAFLYGLSASELTTEELDYEEKGYEMTIAIRAVKSAPAGSGAARLSESLAFDRQANPQAFNRGLILMYHRVTHLGADPFSLNVTPENFRQQLEILKTHAHPMSLCDLTAALASGTAPPRAVALTFDDGYFDNLENAKPMLEEAGIPATIFITTGPLENEHEFWWDELERIFLEPGILPPALNLSVGGKIHSWDLTGATEYTAADYEHYRSTRAEDDPPTLRHAVHFSVWQFLQPLPDRDRRAILDHLSAWAGIAMRRRPEYRTVTVPELKTLGEGDFIEIGAHTITHPMLPDLAPEAQGEEIRNSRLRLEQILGRPVTSFAYPYGVLSDAAADAVKAGGFERACSTVPALVTPATDPYALPRVQVDDWDGPEFLRRLEQWFDPGNAAMLPSQDFTNLRDAAGHPSKFQFRAAGSTAAGVNFPSADSGHLRISIQNASPAAYDVQVNLPGLEVLAHHEYTISFRARSDAPRRISVGFSRARDPWEGLGFYASFDVTRDWQFFEESFIASHDDSNARIHFDLAETAVAVELAAVNFRARDLRSQNQDSDISAMNGSLKNSPSPAGSTRSLTPLERPVFLIGSGRCGSTLLQRLVNSNPEFLIWGEHSGFLRNIADAHRIPAIGYWNVNDWLRFQPEDFAAREKCVRDLDRWTGWDNGINYQDFQNLFREFLLRCFTSSSREPVRWGFKEVRYGRFKKDRTLLFLHEMFPAARTVILIRDPFATVASVIQSWASPITTSDELDARIFKVTRFWVRMYEIHFLFHHQFPDSTLLLRYEDLAVPGTRQRLESFLGAEQPFHKWDEVLSVILDKTTDRVGPFADLARERLHHLYPAMAFLTSQVRALYGYPG